MQTKELDLQLALFIQNCSLLYRRLYLSYATEEKRNYSKTMIIPLQMNSYQVDFLGLN